MDSGCDYMVISSGERPLTELIRELIRRELKRGETTSKGGNTLITSEKDLHLVTRGTHKAYYNGVEIGSEGGDTVKVSSNDITPGYLNGKLVASTGIVLTENNDGGNETLSISVAGGSYGDVYTNVDNIFTADHQTIRGAGGSEANSPTLLFRNTTWAAADYRMLQLTDGGLLNIGQGDYTSIHMTSPACFDSSMRPNSSDGIDVGGSSNWWRDVYAQKYFIDDTNTYINNVAGNMKFFDAANATGKTLTELAAGGNHAALSNLDYASAGHTGFFPLVAGSGNKLTGALYINMTTPSIALQTAGDFKMAIQWDGTDSVITSYYGNVIIDPPTGSAVDLRVNNVSKLAVGASVITAAVDLNFTQDPSAAIYFKNAAGTSTYASIIAGTTTFSLLAALGNLNLTAQTSGKSITFDTISGTRLTIADTAITAAVPLAMGANKITGLAAGTIAGDAVRYEQLTGVYSSIYSSLVYIIGINYITIDYAGTQLYSGTSASTAIQTAINNAGVGGKTIIKKGVYLINTKINNTYNYSTLEGESTGTLMDTNEGTILKADTGYTGDILQLGAAGTGNMLRGPTVKDIGVYGNTINLTGLVIYSNTGLFERIVSANNGNHGILAVDHVDGASGNTFRDITTRNNLMNGLYIQCPDTFLFGIGSYLNGITGLTINGGGTSLIGGNIWRNGAYEIDIEGVSNYGVWHINISNCIIGDAIAGVNASLLINVTNATGSANDINIHDNIFYADSGSYPSEQIKLTLDTVSYALNDIRIHGNRFGTLCNAVQIYGSSASYIKASIYHNKVPTQSFINNWNFDWFDNQGYRTENGGHQEFVGNGTATSFSWPHGLVTIPNLCNVTKTTANIPIWWIGKNATNITVYFETPLAVSENVFFEWNAKIWYHNTW